MNSNLDTENQMPVVFWGSQDANQRDTQMKKRMSYTTNKLYVFFFSLSRVSNGNCSFPAVPTSVLFTLSYTKTQVMEGGLAETLQAVAVSSVQKSSQLSQVKRFFPAYTAFCYF